MALIQSIWLPRRGKRSTMMGTKKTQVLAKGEFFTEYPDSGVGTGHGKVKMGDGVTDYEHLPYFLGDTENEKIAFTSNTSTTVAAALNAVVSGATLKNIVAGLKQAIVKCDANVTKLNDESSTTSLAYKLKTHNHDAVYSKLNHNHNTAYAAKTHTHDDRYYTEAEINTKINELRTSFQAGVNSLYNKLVGLGFTPANKDLNSIMSAINKMYNDRYNAGRTQGQNDVKANPAAFGIKLAPGKFANISVTASYNGTATVYESYGELTIPRTGPLVHPVTCTGSAKINLENGAVISGDANVSFSDT